MSDGWWIMVMFMYLNGDLENHMREIREEAAAEEAFEEYARDCTYLELDDDGRATHHICRHPARDDLSDWVMCDRRACPFMVLNASPEERREYDLRLAMESTNACCRNEEGTDAD